MATLDVPKKTEEALFYRLKSKGFNQCKEVGEAYAACCKDRTISIAWACRSEMAALNTCMAQHTQHLEVLKQRWVAAGRPQQPDWDALLSGL
ncbi:CMC1 [Auxenochlorella protothecoides x Auxenochlorella symbiontica]